MSIELVGLLAFGSLLLLLALRVPVAVAMITVGFVGQVLLVGWEPTVASLRNSAFDRFSSYTFSIIPLFLLMGEFAGSAGLSRDLFRAANAWVGHRRGGVAMAAIAGSAGFGAIAGSSLATAATMGQVALPEMRRLGYSGAFATGTVAAGGTLGILIPPSIVLVIYGILTEQNIATLFAAAFVPALIAVVGYLLTIRVYVSLRPDESGTGERASWQERLGHVGAVWPVLAIFLLVIGGIYLGYFTPTEAAAIGALSTLLVAVIRRGFTWRRFFDCLLGAATTSGMIFLILLGADQLNVFLAVSRLPQELAAWFTNMELSGLAVVIAIVILYLLLGMIMDSLSMILLTTPILFPIVMGLDFGMPAGDVAIWFGILTLMTVEVGLITPPVGLNIYLIHSLAKDVPMVETFRGVVPFFVSDLVRVALLTAFPALSLVGARLLL